MFTPNGDGINDYFKFVYHHAVKKAQTVIINRWGNQVFESNKVEFKWNGSVNNSGAECTGGTYFYVITLTDLMGKKYKENGYIQLARD